MDLCQQSTPAVHDTCIMIKHASDTLKYTENATYQLAVFHC